MLKSLVNFLEVLLFTIIVLVVGIYVLSFPIKGLLHYLYTKGVIKSKKFALDFEDIFRYKLLCKCRYYYLKSKKIEASKEWLEMEFKRATSNWWFPKWARIEVGSMLQAEYFYATYFDLADFNEVAYLEMYEDFARGKYKEKELYNRKQFLIGNLPEDLRDDKTVNELLLLVENKWLDPSGQPFTQRTNSCPNGRKMQEIVLACYYIHPDNYSVLFGKLWNISPNNVKSHKSNALYSTNLKKNTEEISRILGRDVNIKE